MALLPQFILFGDSITQGSYDQLNGFGMGAELQAAYARRFDVINRGFSGYNTDHALQIISRVLPTPEQATIKLITIWFGANDANRHPDSWQHVPLPRFKANLHALITHPAITAHSPNIILITPPPVEETVHRPIQEGWGEKGDIRRNEDARAYAEVAKEVGKEAGVAVLDAWGDFMKLTGWKGEDELPGSEKLGRNEVLAGLLPDGLHLSGSGYKVVYDGLIALIKEKWPEYPPYKMPYREKIGWEIELGDQFWDIAG